MQEGAGPRPFDVSLSFLIELDARGWLDWLKLPVAGPIESIESDVGTVLAEVDKVLRIGGSEPWLAHIEVQAGHDPRLETRLLQYHALLHHRHGLPVETTVVLLRPEADSPHLTGRYVRRSLFGNTTISFGYRVIRLWERPLRELLDGGLGVLPLAPLANVRINDLPPIILRLDERLNDETDSTTADEIWQTIMLLLRLRYDEDEVQTMTLPSEVFRETRLYRLMMERVRQDYVEQVRAEERVSATRHVLIALGTDKLGPPDAATTEALGRITDPESLERLIRGVLNASTWQELLTAETDS